MVDNGSSDDTPRLLAETASSAAVRPASCARCARTARALRGAQPRGARSARRAAALSRRRRAAAAGLARGLPHGVRGDPRRRRRGTGRTDLRRCAPGLARRALSALSLGLGSRPGGRSAALQRAATGREHGLPPCDLRRSTATSSSSSGARATGCARARRSSTACGSSAAARRSSTCRRPGAPSCRDATALGRLDGGALRRPGLFGSHRRVAPRRLAGTAPRAAARRPFGSRAGPRSSGDVDGAMPGATPAAAIAEGRSMRCSVVAPYRARRRRRPLARFDPGP